MGQTLTESEIWDCLESVKHPAINLSLVRLGIVHEVELKKDVVMVLMKFPFQGVPIGEQLIQSIRNAIHYLDLKTEIVVTLMDQNELQKFLSLEEKYWNG